MTKDEALRMALEALEKLFGIPDMLTGENSGDVAVWRLGGSYRTQQAIHAIKEALAQPKREILGNVDYIPCCTDQTCPKCKPPQSEPEWVGLTDEEIFAEVKRIDPDEQYLPKALTQFARAILKAAKEKNT